MSYVGALLGEHTRTARARVTLANPGLVWRAGLCVNVALTPEQRDAPVAVLSEAIQTVNDSPTVFMRIAAGFVGKVVRTGRVDATHTGILRGIQAGTAYAAGGQFRRQGGAGQGSTEHVH